MLYNTRNLNNINTLADNTKKKTLELYNYAKEIGFEILIYEGIRTKAQQEQNVKNKKSKTMKSYHLVGQAFDYVPVNSKGDAMWSIGAYVSPKGLQFINKAKSLGFTWGGDWDNDGNWRDETFLDSPHMQYNFRGYGTDTFVGKPTSTTAPIKVPIKEYLSKDDKGEAVTKLQENLKYLGYSIEVDGVFGDNTVKVVKKFQSDHGLTADGFFGSKSATTLEKSVGDKKGGLTMSQYEELKRENESLKKEIEELKQLVVSKADYIRDGKVSSSHNEGWEFLIANKLSDGTNPQGALTRQQFGTLLKRYHDKFSKK